MLFLCGAAEMKCVDIGGGRAEKRSGAQYEYNNDERENKIIISCQSHTGSVQSQSWEPAGADWPSAPDFILIRGQQSITVVVESQSNNITHYNYLQVDQQKT